MALASVGTASCGVNVPEVRYRGNGSLIVVAATKWPTGTPRRAAITPAVRLPRLPLGTTTVGGGAPAGNCSAAQA
jgi:hypothetical protein